MIKEEINIIILLWKGDFRGRDYRDENVWSLYYQIEQNIDRPFRTYCLTNDMNANVPGEKIELLHNWPGWWAKMELFRPDLPCGRIFFTDLDTFIVNSLEPMLRIEDNCVLFAKGSDSSRVRQGKKIVDKYRSTAILFNSGSLSWIYQRFKESPDHWMNKYRGDQDALGDWLSDSQVTLFERKWMIKLEHVKDKLPKDLIIITGTKGGKFRYYREKIENLKRK